MYCGKSLLYESKDDAIHPDTKVIYRDQNGNERGINIKELLKLVKKSKKKTDLMTKLVKDIEGSGLHIGFPIIVALNDLAEEFGDKVNKILIKNKT